MKKRQRLEKYRAFMFLMTVFVAVFTATYTIRLKSTDTEGDENYSDTIYRTLASDDSKPLLSFSDNTETNSEALPPESSEKAPKSISGTAAEKQNADRKKSPDIGKIEEIRVQDAATGEILELDIEEYVAGVVAAEMPSSAPAQALKAQAVASRTLAVTFALADDKTAHNGADVCTSASHCQGFALKDKFTDKYGEYGVQVFQKAENAAEATKGIIILYDDAPIVAAFHASSGNFTASCSEVWGGNLDYLVSVETRESTDTELKNQVLRTESFSRDDFIERLSASGVTGLSAYSGTPFSEWVSGISRTKSGRVDFMEIGGTPVSGSLIRKALGLRSSDFTVSYSDNHISFTCSGYGHGVGMSQLGAIVMAKEGEDFYDILKYYYPGVSFGFI